MILDHWDAAVHTIPYDRFPETVMLEERDGYYAAGRMLRAANLVDALGQENNPEWKTVAFNTNGEMVAPNLSLIHI